MLDGESDAKCSRESSWVLSHSALEVDRKWLGMGRAEAARQGRKTRSVLRMLVGENDGYCRKGARGLKAGGLWKMLDGERWEMQQGEQMGSPKESCQHPHLTWTGVGWGWEARKPPGAGHSGRVETVGQAGRWGMQQAGGRCWWPDGPGPPPGEGLGGLGLRERNGHRTALAVPRCAVP